MSHYKIWITSRLLHFKQPAGTSRGTYTTRQVWYVSIADGETGRWGIGECAPLPDLSCDNHPNYALLLRSACDSLAQTGRINRELLRLLRPYPSILFGLETALAHLEAGSLALWDTPFSRGEAGIPINGLIWMGDYKRMQEQIDVKLNAGYRCVKLKIGAIDFEQELALLKRVRQDFKADTLELRVDANGAFSSYEVLDKLRRLAECDLHSIEQPMRPGQWEEMAELIARSPIPIALDEELIGHNSLAEKRKLLHAIVPHYLVLKPSLHGGIQGCTEWIKLAETCMGSTPERPKWWITSALESNVGLNAIAHWCATLGNPLPQGLGTGLLFTDNVEMPLTIRKDCLWFSPDDSLTDLTTAKV